MTETAPCKKDDCDGTVHATGKKLKWGFDCDTCMNSFRRNLQNSYYKIIDKSNPGIF